MARRNPREEKKSGKLAPGFCRVCGRVIRGLSGLTVWWCPRCRKLLARTDQDKSGTIEIRCPRCKALVQLNGEGITFADQGLTAAAH